MKDIKTTVLGWLGGLGWYALQAVQAGTPITLKGAAGALIAILFGHAAADSKKD